MHLSRSLEFRLIMSSSAPAATEDPDTVTEFIGLRLADRNVNLANFIVRYFDLSLCAEQVRMWYIRDELMLSGRYMHWNVINGCNGV